MSIPEEPTPIEPPEPEPAEPVPGRFSTLLDMAKPGQGLWYGR
jgi:hypothetical protein